MDDYANVIEAFIALYEVTFNIEWLDIARQLAQQAIKYYYSAEEGMFFYTAADDEQLIARKTEIMDGVISSSNSVMAMNLKKLGLFYTDEIFGQIVAQLLRNLMPYMAKYGSAYSNWASVLLYEIIGMYQVAVASSASEDLLHDLRAEMEQHYLPNKVMLGGTQENLPLLENRVNSEARIYICRDKTCGFPVSTVADAIKQIRA